MKLTILSIALIIGNSSYAFHEQGDPKSKYISIQFRLDPSLLKDSGLVEFMPVEAVRFEWKKAIKNGDLTWQINTSEPVILYFNRLFNQHLNSWLAEPGDRLVVNWTEKGLIFSGSGSEKFKLYSEIDSVIHNLAQPANRKDHRTYSLADYLEWNDYFNRQLNIILPLIDSYRDKISTYAYDYIRTGFLDQYIDDRGDKFNGLRENIQAIGITNKDLCAIYDTSYYPSVAKWYSYTSSRIFGNWSFVRNKIYRGYSFDVAVYPLNDNMKWTLLQLEECLKYYKGVQKEKLMQDFLPRMMREFGFCPEVEKLLTWYYRQPGYPAYKDYIKKEEQSLRKIWKGKEQYEWVSPNFMAEDKSGNPFTKEKIKGKVVVLNYWVSGNAGCIQMAAALKKVEERCKPDTNIVFIHIALDKSKEQLCRSIAQKKYTTGTGIQLSSIGMDDTTRKFFVEDCPKLRVMDAEGKIIWVPVPLDPRKDGGKALIETVQKYSAFAKDGPYLFYDKAVLTAYTTNQDKVSTKQLNPGSVSKLAVQTDQIPTFAVLLKTKLVNEESEFAKPDKLLVLSDIEGNFDALRKLLQTNKVIDKDFKWIFGKGHLVFAGDMFDRGMQVTECLWLLYSLEDKAKKAGGYVHFILGNHEIMNLQGDHGYVKQKYIDNAALMGKTLTGLYNENSELGRWLRTKNIMEKIGDLLFVHGGVSPGIYRSSLTVRDINNLARPYYSTKPDSSASADVQLIYNSKKTNDQNSYPSPFWFRGYYSDPVKYPKEIPTFQQLDSALQKFGVRRIITGHTIVADTVSVHYDRRVINTDTKHAKGKSEALLIEGNRYYRLNQEGTKVLLFTDAKN